MILSRVSPDLLYNLGTIVECLSDAILKRRHETSFFILQSTMGLLDKVLGFEFRPVRIVIDQLTP
jgi:hypothetical protein